MESTMSTPPPGFWELEATHHGLRPLTHFLRDAYVRGGEAGFADLTRRNGLPLDRVAVAILDGCLYMRPMAIGESETPKPPPPTWLLRLVVRLHPELRRRARTAKALFAERRWRAEVDQWFDRDRAEVVRANHAFQAVDLAVLDDAGLLAHLDDTVEHFIAQARRNLATHGGDMIPTGDLLAHCERWGIDAGEACSLLAGASPATRETATVLAPVAAALATSSSEPTSMEEVLALGPEVSDAVAAWRAEHAWRLVTSDDIDRPTIGESPALELRAVLGGARPVDEAVVDPGPVRSRVPVADQPLFDELVAEARYGMRQRDDIRGICWNWPAGLVRRAVLEVGLRLVERGHLAHVDHVVELTPPELATLLTSGVGPDAATLTHRAAERERIERLPPPRSFGEPEDPPPLEVFPPAMARATAAIMAMLAAEATPTDLGELRGVGVGTKPYRGRACVIDDVTDALERLAEGDVLVASVTGPSFNSLMPLVGALVVEEGGPMCHAAIVAREFGIPALIGTAGATRLIPDGAPIEVDPEAGVIRLT